MIYETIGVDKVKFECDVQIFHNVVIVTQTLNSSAGIILNAEILANEICNKYPVPTNLLVWIEVILPEVDVESTGYYLVMFTVNNWVCNSPRRIPITAEIAEAFKKHGDNWTKISKLAETNNK